jgi:hypothetical protein
VSFPSAPERPDRVRPAWIPPRADLPGRPDVPARCDRLRRGGPWWILPVAIGSALVLSAVVGITIADDSRSTGPGPALSSPNGDYAFLEERAFLGRHVPVRWNPCEPIQYEVNVQGAPADALDEIQGATARVSEATGITFTFDGTTDRSLRQTGHDSFYSNGNGGTYYPVLFVWIPHDRMLRLTKHREVLAFTHPELGEADRSDQWVSGWVVVDAGGGFEPSGRYSLELVLMHELGHLVGLGHVSDPDELMFSSQVAPSTRPDQMDDWGAGDLAGLELLGRGQGCMDHVDVAP